MKTNNRYSGFTLLEVLVSGGILFIVAAAVVGLSNSIIQGTAINNDTTITNRWAVEGLELTTKVRDDTVKQTGFTSGQAVWFEPATQVSDYGWYYLDDTSNGAGTSWKLTRVSALENIINLSTLDLASLPVQTKLQSDSLSGNRLICVEAVGAQTMTEESKLSCNTYGVVESGSKKMIDGDRLRISYTNCDRGRSSGLTKAEDLFCKLTLDSINRDKIRTNDSDKIEIADGNAVKVRSVVVWNDRGKNLTTDIATLLTNWKSVEQL